MSGYYNKRESSSTNICVHNYILYYAKLTTKWAGTLKCDIKWEIPHKKLIPIIPFGSHLRQTFF